MPETQGPIGPRGRIGPSGEHWVWRTVLTVWIVLFSAVAIFLYLRSNSSADKATSLAAQNQERINDIQQARGDSCRQTYHSFPKVFIKLFPPKKKLWNPEQRDIWDKLVKSSNALADGCPAQTKIKKNKKAKADK